MEVEENPGEGHEHDETKKASSSKERRRKRCRKRKIADEERDIADNSLDKRPEKKSGKVDRKGGRDKVPRPNVFTALQVTDASIRRHLKEVQDGALESDSSLKEFFVSTSKAHVTLHAFYVAEDRLGEVENALREAVDKWRRRVGKEGALKLHFDGVGTFKDGGPTKVVFAKVAHSAILDQFYKSLTDDIMRLDLESVKLSSTFQPHLTIMKLSRAKSSSGRKRKTIEREHYAAFQEKDLGVQVCQSLQLLSMTKPQDRVTGYYSKIAEIPLMEDDFSPASKVPKSDAERGVQTKIRDFLNSRSLRSVLCSPKTLLVCSVIAFATWKLRKSWLCKQ